MTTASYLAAAATVIDGGGTFDRDLHAVHPTDGYAVGLVRGTWRTVPAHEAGLGDTLLEAAQVYADAYVGTWVDAGLVHVDPVIILTCREDAIRLATALGQKAVYDFASQSDIEVL